MDYRTFRSRMLAEDPELRRLYEAESRRLERQIARAVARLRMEKGWTQAQLAEALGTTQSVVARLESGTHRPSLATLQKVAHVLGARLNVQLEKVNE